MTRAVHPIERESYRILRDRIDLSHLPPLSRAVTERVIHASADLEYAETLVFDEPSLQAGRTALSTGAPLLVDARMVAAGITSRETICLLEQPAPAAAAVTRSAAAVRRAAPEIRAGAVWVIGNAPTALFELLSLAERGALAPPALVIGLPVGFVGAAESKAALAASGLPCLTNRGEKGGSAVASAAVNALIYEERKP